MNNDEISSNLQAIVNNAAKLSGFKYDEPEKPWDLIDQLQADLAKQNEKLSNQPSPAVFKRAVLKQQKLVNLIQIMEWWNDSLISMGVNNIPDKNKYNWKV